MDTEIDSVRRCSELMLIMEDVADAAGIRPGGGGRTAGEEASAPPNRFRRALLKKLRELHTLKLKHAQGLLDGQQTLKLSGEAALRSQLAAAGVSREEQDIADPLPEVQLPRPGARMPTERAPTESQQPSTAVNGRDAHCGRGAAGGPYNRRLSAGGATSFLSSAQREGGVDCSSLGRATRVGDIIAAVSLAGPRELSGSRAAHGLHALAQLLQAGCKLGADGAVDAALQRLFNATVSDAARLDAKCVCKAAWALGAVHNTIHGHGAPSGCICQRALHQLAAGASAGSLDARAIAGLVHALGSAGCAPPPPLTALLDVAARLAADPSGGGFTPQDCANLLWGVARLDAPVPPSLDAALPGLLRALLPDAKPVEVSQVAWALAKLKLACEDQAVPPLYGVLCSGGPQGLSAQGAANCLWAVSRLTPAPASSLTRRLLAQAERQAADLTPQGVANVCAACARLQGPPAIPLRLLRAHAHTLSACDVAEACWALGKLWIDSRASDGAAGTTDGPAGASGAEVVADWVGVAGALWRRAAQVCGGMDWQAAGRLEFSFRSLAPLSLHGAVPHSPLLDQLSRTALASIRALERSSGNADSAAAAALLRVGGTIWSDHSTHPEVLFALVPGQGGCRERLVAQMMASTTCARVSHWCRFAEKGAAEASPWPAPSSRKGGYSLALLRLPHSAAAFEMAAAAAATVLACGSPLFVFGCSSEGAAAMETRIGALRSPLGELYFEGVAVVAESDRTDVHGARVVRAHRRGGAITAVNLAAFEKRSELSLPGAAAPVDWRAYPGLFSGGGLDVMTKALLQALLPAICPRNGHGSAGVRSRGRILDFCCGSGVIGAALAHAMPELRISMLDADAVALVAARVNVPLASMVLSDAWAALPRKPRFDAIVSNPPVHHGLLSDMSILRALIRRAAARLRPGGSLWLVCQDYVPARSIFDEERRMADERGAKVRLQPAEAVYDDGRFVVWRAVRYAGRASTGGDHFDRKGKRKR